MRHVTLMLLGLVLLAGYGGLPVEKRIDTGVTVVTAENLNDPEIVKLLKPS